MKFLETELGFELLTSNYLIFFGKKESSIENLQKKYPDFQFKSLWQVHGNDLHHTTPSFENNSVKADAHWTEEKNLALISKSADCIPVLAINQDNQTILAIHAGWRGVQNKIIPKSLQSLGKNWEIYIGPHITSRSFEIQEDVIQLLEQCTSLPKSDWLKGQKADLLAIVSEQIQSVSRPKETIHPLIYDTFSDLRFHSFRRDRDKAGRQNSFIVRL